VNTIGGNATVTTATTNINGAIGGSGGVTFGGESTVPSVSSAINGLYVLNASNTYSGPTTIMGNSTVRLGGNERISNSSTLVMAGGTLDLAGFSETLGGLDLDANATIALGASNKISFGSSALLDWGAYTLNFTSVGGSLAADAVRFGTSSSALTVSQLSLITVNGAGGYGLDSNGFLAAIPEPSAFGALAGFGVLGLVATRRRRRAV
jgi:fibronectin-binding autotransporter adhesin